MHRLSRARARVEVFVALAMATSVLGACDTGGDAPGTDGGADASGADASGGTDRSIADAGTRDSGAVDDDAGPSSDAGSVDAGGDPVPAFRTPVATPDLELARAALRIMGAPAAGATAPYCNECHTLSRRRIRYWRALSDTALTTCLDDLAVTSDASAARMVDCIRASGEFTTAPMGVFATAANLGWFRYVFRHGAGGADWMATHADFLERAGMPPPMDATGMTQAQFDIVAEWFIRGVPELDAVLPEDPRPADCLPGVSSDVIDHVTAMRTTGWAAVNEGASMLMYGCAGAASAAGCLATEPLASTTTFGATWETVPGGVPGARLRVLATTGYASAYWTRSSPDGRFVSHGAAMAPNLRFIDLQNGDREIGGNADYDPAFFPDGSGFMVQDGTNARVCENRVLYTGAPTSLTFTEPGCSAGTGIGLYEHVGTALGGGDYWAIAAGPDSAEYDNGGQGVTLRDPDAAFPSTASHDITLLTNTGSSFMVTGDETIVTPYEGDAVISPSLRLIVNRVSGAGGAQLGFALRRVDVTGSGATLAIETPEIARYCLNGGKPGFSYDERWMVLHHYIGDADAVDLGFTGPADPAFAMYRTRGAANVYLVDLTTGRRTRITNMGPGQYALFPHFRSDGWIYFIVRTAGALAEHIVASDAALLYVD